MVIRPAGCIHTQLVNCALSLCRKASRLVLAVLIVFIILMLPRGVSLIIKIASPTYDKLTQNTHHTIDMVLEWFHYLNHAINFFVYVLASKDFRFRSELIMVLSVTSISRKHCTKTYGIFIFVAFDFLLIKTTKRPICETCLYAVRV